MKNKPRFPRKLTDILLPLGIVVVGTVYSGALNAPAYWPGWLAFSLLAMGIGFQAILGGNGPGKIWPSGKARRIAWIGIAMWLGASMVSVLYARIVPDAIIFTVHLALGIVWMAVLIQYLRKNPLMGKLQLALGITLLSSIQGLIAIGQHFEIWGMGIPNGEIWACGTQSNPNLLASLVVFALPFSFMLMNSGAGYLRRIGWGAIPIAMLTIWVSESRTALLVMVVWVICATILLLKVRKNASEKIEWSLTRIISASLVVFLIVFTLASFGMSRKVGPESFSYLTAENPTITRDLSSSEVRMVLWNRTVEMGMDANGVGVGAGNWQHEIPGYGIKGFGDQGNYGTHFFLRPHNDYLQIFAETGFLGVFGWGLFVIMLMLISLKEINSTPSLKEKIERGILILGVLGYLIVATFGFPGERAPQMMAFFALAALILRNPSTTLAPTTNKIRIALSIFIIAITCAISAIIAMHFLRFDPLLKAMREAKEQKNWSQVVEVTQKAKTFWQRTEPQSATPIEWFEGLAYMGLGRQMEGLETFRRGLAISPHNFPLRANFAAAYALTNNPTQAISEYQKLLKDFPDYDEGWLNLAICYLQTGNKSSAKTSLSNISIGYRHPNLERVKEQLR